MLFIEAVVILGNRAYLRLCVHVRLAQMMQQNRTTRRPRTATEPTTMPAMAPLDRVGSLVGGSVVGVAWDTDVVLGWGRENNLEKAPEM